MGNPIINIVLFGGKSIVNGGFYTWENHQTKSGFPANHV